MSEIQDINERFKKLREVLELSQEQFGKSIGLSKSGISNIEKKLRNVTEKHIKLIISAFNVREEWLRYGEEPMFIATRKEITNELVKQYDLDELGKEFVEKVLLLDKEDILTLIKISEAMIYKKNGEQLSSSSQNEITSTNESIQTKQMYTITGEVELSKKTG